MKHLLVLSICFFLIATTANAQQSKRGFYRGGLSSGFIVFFVNGNGELAVYTSDFGKMSAGGGTVSSDTAFFSFNTFGSDKSTAGQITGTLSADSVSGNFTPTASPAETFTATKVPIFGSTADVAGRYFGVAFTGSPIAFTPFTLLLDSQGRVVVSGLGIDSISSVTQSGFGGRFTDPIGPDIEQEFYETHSTATTVGATLISGPNTNATIAHDVMFGTYELNGVTYQFRASRESSANHVANIATRGYVTTGQYGQLIGGFIITGGPKLVLIRGIGPGIRGFFPPPPNFPGSQYLGNPMLQLFTQNNQTPIAANDDWQTNANVADINSTGIAPTDPKDAALLVRLEPGSYTAVLSSADGGEGVAVVEAYEIDKD